MKVFLVGARSTIGNALVDELKKTDHEIVVLSRRLLSDPEISYIQADPTEKGEWMDVLAESDIVYNLVGSNIFSKYWTESEKSNLARSRILIIDNIIKAMNQSDKRQKLITASGADYYPSTDSKIFAENDKPGDDWLSTMFYQWEIAHNNLNSTKECVIYRMGVNFSPSGKTAEKIFETHRKRIGGYTGDGKAIMPWIHIEDTIRAFIWAMKDDISGIYNLCAPDINTHKEIAIIGGHLLGRKTSSKIPKLLKRAILGERVELFNKGRAMNVDKLESTGFKFKYRNIEQALYDIFDKSKLFTLKV